LASGVLLKDNHIALVGSVREAVRRARANASHVLRVVVEVDNLSQLDEALEAGAEGVLLDNFQARDMVEAVKRVRERRPQVVIEASGGVTLDRIHEISKTGVDVVSIGSITHSARAVDFSCEIRPTDGARERDS
jgi:nicotinate-nucleotide pyrophosphorylase (carboxylating)